MGQVLYDRYEIQEVIGVGGMGSVYRARDLHFPGVVKLVAVKEMINSTPDPVVRQTIIQNFDREANILVTLNHPSIPKIFDYFSIDERSYLVLEFIQGKDIEAILLEKQELFSDEQVLGWAIEICDVLTFLHDHKPEPIVFRDMKPSNIMVTPQNHIMLVDFGIAKVFRTGQKGTMIGTEGYSPPEQYRGEATLLADVYSFGATFHHILTQRDPRLEAPFTFHERPIRKYNPGVSVELEAVISKALEYDQKDRFQSIRDLKEAIIQCGKKTGSLSRIHYAPTIINQEQSIKPLWTFQCEDEIRSTAAVENGVVYIGSYDNNLYAVGAGDGKMLWKFPTDAGVVSKPLVKDSIVYITSADKSLYAISTRTGKELWKYTADGPIRCSPQAAAGQMFFGSDDGFFYAINVATNRLTWKVDIGSAIRSSPCIANDFIYFGSESGDFSCLDFYGKSLWKAKARKAVTSNPVVQQDMVFFTSQDGICYSLDSKAGWSIWKFRMDRGSISSPCVWSNFVVFGSADGNIYCLDVNSAKEVWRYKTAHQVSGSPMIYKDAVYCGAADGSLYSLEAKNGKLRWKFNTGQPITSTPVIDNGIIFLGSSDHILYALMT